MQLEVIRRDVMRAILYPSRQVSHVEVQEITMMPGAKAPLHLHPCPTMGIVTDGVITFQIEGEAEQKLSIGDSFYEPENVRVSKFNNETDHPATFVAFYLLGEDETETIHVL